MFRKNRIFSKNHVLCFRNETEWIELVNNGTAKLVDADPERISREFLNFVDIQSDLEYPAFYGDGKTAEFILNEILFMFEKEVEF